MPCKNQVLKLDSTLKIGRKLDLIHRVYRIHFTVNIFELVAVKTLNPSTYLLKDADEQLIEGNFQVRALVRFEAENV